MNKAQIAMEYIITYGWALLAVMVLIGGLSFFGIFEPEDALAESCYISSDILCEDYRIIVDEANNIETLEVYVKNTHRENYYVSKVQCVMGSEYTQVFDANTFLDKDDNSKLITLGGDYVGLLETNRFVKITCSGDYGSELAPKDSKIKAKILLDLQTDTSFVHQIEGEVIARVK